MSVHAGFIHTDMAALAADVPKLKAELSRDQELIYPPVQEFWDAAVSGQQGQPHAGDRPHTSDQPSGRS